MRFTGAGLSLAAAAAACGVSQRSFRRWESDNRAPLAVLKLLRLLSGRLDALDSAFKGFWIHQGRIFNDQFPQGVLAGDLRAANYVQQERDFLRVENDKLRAQVLSLTQSTHPTISKGGALVVPTYFPRAWNFTAKTAQRTPPRIRAELSRNTPRWFGFSARAGPLGSAAHNFYSTPKLSPPSVAGAPDHVCELPEATQTEGAWFSGLDGIPVPDNQAIAPHASIASRQTCRLEHGLTLSATHGCVAPRSMDGRASQYPAPLFPQTVPLALQSGADSSASRPVSSSSPCANAQADGQKSGDIKQSEYLLCEIGHADDAKQDDDCSGISDNLPEPASFAGCKSVTPDFNDCRTVYGLRFSGAGLSLAAAAAACGVSERSFRREMRLKKLGFRMLRYHLR